MNKLLMLTLMLLSLRCFAYPCPVDVESNAKAKAIRGWMSELQGKQNLKNCYLEITVCDPAEAGESPVIGEVYIVDEDKREGYLPLTVATLGDEKMKTKLDASSFAFYYIKYDYYFEEEFGRTEASRLDIHLDEHRLLRSIDLGLYATRKKIHSPDGNESRWYSCVAAKRP